jgi:hypothetical protein
VSERYPGGIITKTPGTPTGPYQNGTAPGIWTLDQQLQFQQQGIWPTAGLLPNYIEDVFSTYLYTGNGSTQTITNGIDLSTKGGLVWQKYRNATSEHGLTDTVRGAGIALDSSTTGAQASKSWIDSFTSTGFVAGAYTGTATQVAWTFRKQAKFFDVVTWTGNGSASRSISHNLGSVPGCIIVKCTSNATNWPVYHSGLNSGVNPQDYAIYLNLTNDGTGGGRWGGVAPTSTTFNVNNDSSVNTNSYTYVAYLFASNAGGFGSAGTDNVITCGSFTTDGSGNATVNLGYEPQWILVKQTNAADSWRLLDNMRGMPTSGQDGRQLFPNTSGAEQTVSPTWGAPTATGFNFAYAGSSTYIYIAIRRGPMATPTVGTSVFSPYTYNTPSNGTQVTTSFPVSMGIWKNVDGGASGQLQDRLRGFPPNSTTGSPALYPDYAGSESDNYTAYNYWNTGFLTNKGANDVWWSFQRAPGFFDEVCWTGTSSNGGATATFNHNLGVAPEMIIVKLRSVNGASGYSQNWFVYTTSLNSTYGYPYNGIYLNSNAAFTGVGMVSSAPTTTTFTLEGQTNVSPATYAAYLFATLAGVSKVGTFTGTGGTQTIDCGFGSGGARWLMVKRTDSTGNWYVFDSARGFTSSSSPYLLMNSTAAQVTGNNGCYAASTGFTLTSNASATVNISAASYIFLAIA